MELAPADGARSRVLVEGRAVGVAAVSAWPAHLAISEVTLDADAPEGTELALLLGALAGYDAAPARITHAGILERATLRWWRDGPFGARAVATGFVGDRHLFYDPLERLPDGELLHAVVVLYADTFDPPAEVEAPPLAARLTRGTWLDRIVTLRHLGSSEQRPPALVDELHHFALHDENYAVRQFAATQMSGLLPGIPYRPDPGRQLAGLRDPLATARSLRPRPERLDTGEAFDARHARRNVRLALLWSLGNLAWGSRGYAADPGATTGLSERLEAELEAATLPADRDRWLWELARDEVIADAPTWGIGTEQPLGLLDMVRYAVHRGRIVRALGEWDQDRFYWLATSVEAVWPSPASPTRGEGGSDDRRLAGIVYGPSPASPLSPRALPPWLRGANPYATPAGG